MFIIYLHSKCDRTSSTGPLFIDKKLKAKYKFHLVDILLFAIQQKITKQKLHIFQRSISLQNVLAARLVLIVTMIVIGYWWQ
jgi:hypothetical protein